MKHIRTSRRDLSLLLSLFIMVGLSLASCDPPVDGEPDNTNQSQLLRESAVPPPERTVLSRTEAESDREDFVVYEIRVRETRNISNIANLGVNDDILYPGALIGGTGAATGSIAPPSLPSSLSRKPVTLSLGGISGVEGSLSFAVDNPVLSETRNGINTKLTELIGSNASAAARVEFEKEEVYSSEQLSMSLGVGMNWPSEQYIKAQLDFNSTDEKSRVVVSFRQVYYSVDMDTPTSTSDLFEGSESDINAFISSANPMYVSRVYYGRQVYFIIESSCSSEELSAAVDAAFETNPQNPGQTLDVNFAMSYKSVLDNSTIKAVVYGGDAGQSTQIFTDGYDGLIAFIQQGSTFDTTTGSNAMPLYYQMRFVDDNKIGVISTNAEYTMRQYVRVRQRVQVTLEKLVCRGADDGWFDDTCEFMGTVRVRSVSNADAISDWSTLGDFWTNALSMSNGSQSEQNAQTILTFDPVSATDSFIEVYMTFTEDDTSEDDYMGERTVQQYLSQGWTLSPAPFRFENDGAIVEVYLDYMALP